MTLRVGILHPGEMGSHVAAAARATLGTVYWCPDGRSAASAQRATMAGLSPVPGLNRFCATCDLILGICPPHAARDQAHQVIAAGFRGIYVEANAIAPATVQALAADLAAAGITCVDGGIVGLPLPHADSAWLYLSGPAADTVAACFSEGSLRTRILGTEPGAASALKLCYAAWNKGNTALLTAVQSAADQHGVRTALEERWELDQNGFAQTGNSRIRAVARKAWRFSGEMEEIAALFRASGLPPGFFESAATLYGRESGFKDAAEPPALDLILTAVRNSGEKREKG